MDEIALHSIRVMGRHGANPGERDAEQPFAIDVDLSIDLHAAQSSDLLGDTLDYAALHRQIVDIVGTTSFALLERLAAEVLRAIFADPRVRHARVRIAKPALLEGATPSIVLARDNPRCR